MGMNPTVFFSFFVVVCVLYIIYRVEDSDG
jgi:hypothetical protein